MTSPGAGRDVHHGPPHLLHDAGPRWEVPRTPAQPRGQTILWEWHALANSIIPVPCCLQLHALTQVCLLQTRSTSSQHSLNRVWPFRIPSGAPGQPAHGMRHVCQGLRKFPFHLSALAGHPPSNANNCPGARRPIPFGRLCVHRCPGKAPPSESWRRATKSSDVLQMNEVPEGMATFWFIPTSWAFDISSGFDTHTLFHRPHTLYFIDFPSLPY